LFSVVDASSTRVFAGFGITPVIARSCDPDAAHDLMSCHPMADLDQERDAPTCDDNLTRATLSGNIYHMYEIKTGAGEQNGTLSSV